LNSIVGGKRPKVSRHFLPAARVVLAAMAPGPTAGGALALVLLPSPLEPNLYHSSVLIRSVSIFLTRTRVYLTRHSGGSTRDKSRVRSLILPGQSQAMQITGLLTLPLSAILNLSNTLDVPIDIQGNMLSTSWDLLRVSEASGLPEKLFNCSKGSCHRIALLRLMAAN
jgi:hypothetical protein